MMAARCETIPRWGYTMYKKPELEKFGTFRELTQIGILGATDGYTITGPTGSVSGNSMS